jgi:hypothetical protein
MTDRPLAKYEDGRLWLDVGGVYLKVSRFNVLTMFSTFRHHLDPTGERYGQECRIALQQYDKAKAMEEAKCEAATH